MGRRGSCTHSARRPWAWIPGIPAMGACGLWSVSPQSRKLEVTRPRSGARDSSCCRTSLCAQRRWHQVARWHQGEAEKKAKERRWSGSRSPALRGSEGDVRTRGRCAHRLSRLLETSACSAPWPDEAGAAGLSEFWRLGGRLGGSLGRGGSRAALLPCGLCCHHLPVSLGSLRGTGYRAHLPLARGDAG